MTTRSAACLTLLVLLLALPAAGAAQRAEEAPAEPASAYATRTAWLSRDKAYHFGISVAGAAGVYALGREAGLSRRQAALASSLVVGTAGVLREIFTGRRENLLTAARLSRKDLVWDGVGIVVGISLTDLLLPRRSPADEPR